MDSTAYHQSLRTFEHRTGPSGVNNKTCKSWRFSGKDNEWDGTVFYTKDNVPSCIVCYVWEASSLKIQVGLLKMLGAIYDSKDTPMIGHGHHVLQVIPTLSLPMKLQLSLQVSPNFPDQGSS